MSEPEPRLIDYVVPWFIVILMIIVLFLIPHVVIAQDHVGHPDKDIPIHKRFYKGWNMPSQRSVSCCHDEDCSPAESYMKDGHWFARKVSEPDKEFTEIPDARVERNPEDDPAYDNPDGRSHLCGRRYHFSGTDALTVYCFSPGSGT